MIPLRYLLKSANAMHAYGQIPSPLDYDAAKLEGPSGPSSPSPLPRPSADVRISVDVQLENNPTTGEARLVVK